MSSLGNYQLLGFKYFRHINGLEQITLEQAIELFKQGTQVYMKDRDSDWYKVTKLVDNELHGDIVSKQ